MGTQSVIIQSLVMYRVSELVLDLGWVDFNLVVAAILQRYLAVSAISTQAELGRR